MNLGIQMILTSRRPFILLLAQSAFSLLGTMRSPAECEGRESRSRKSMASWVYDDVADVTDVLGCSPAVIEEYVFVTGTELDFGDTGGSMSNSSVSNGELYNPNLESSEIQVFIKQVNLESNSNVYSRSNNKYLVASNKWYGLTRFDISADISWIRLIHCWATLWFLSNGNNLVTSTASHRSEPAHCTLTMLGSNVTKTDNTASSKAWGAGSSKLWRPLKNTI